MEDTLTDAGSRKGICGSLLLHAPALVAEEARFRQGIYDRMDGQRAGGLALKVLVLASCRWWNASAEGAVAQARALGDAGCEVLFAGPRRSPAFRKAVEAGLPAVGMDLLGAAFPLGVAALSRIASRGRFDAVCVHRSEDQAAAVIASRVPVVRVRSDIRRPSSGPLARLIDGRTALVVFSSPFMLRKGYSRGRRGPVACIPAPVDTERFAPPPVREAGTRIAAVGRLSEIKGHAALIRAVAKVPSARLTIAGAPAQLSVRDLENLAARLGAGDRVEVAGRVEDVAPLYREAFLGVVPSLASEAVSRVAGEMMASGLPVLAAATNSLVDMVLDGRTGLLHPPGDADTLAGQIGYLLANPQVAFQMGAAARERCLSLYSRRAVGEAWLGALRGAGFGRRGGSRAGEHDDSERDINPGNGLNREDGR